jgi:hypothetical protein
MGCNANIKDDSYAGSQLFVLPVDMGCQGGQSGAPTNMHFSVLCFTSALGDPVLCAVILKSNIEIQDIPLKWKMGIDIQKDVAKGGTQFETFKQNYGEGPACTGGPICQYNGKEILCFVGASPKACITSIMLAEKCYI